MYDRQQSKTVAGGISGTVSAFIVAYSGRFKHALLPGRGQQGELGGVSGTRERVAVGAPGLAERNDSHIGGPSPSE